jgi:general secretion pathway protein A
LYLKFFGLNEPPFSITPDPAFVYLSAAHRDALAHLLYGVGQGGTGGFVQLTGEVGTGKTTLCRVLLEQVPEDTQVALILNPLMTPRELLETVCEELGLETDGIGDSSKCLVDTLNRYLLEQTKRKTSAPKRWSRCGYSPTWKPPSINCCKWFYWGNPS